MRGTLRGPTRLHPLAAAILTCSVGGLDEAHARAALSWLAAFHAACWGADAAALGLWHPEGTYWHLHTRLEELPDIGREWAALKGAAHELDARLAATPFRSLCHGDFKTANLLFSDPGRGPVRCAAYDFQYCGSGSGMRDVAYLLASGLQVGVEWARECCSPRQVAGPAQPTVPAQSTAPRPTPTLQARLIQQPSGEEALLRHYHAELLAGLRALAAGGSSSQGGPVGDPASAAEAVERYGYADMYRDYQVALCDYTRWMAGWGWWGNASWAGARTRAFLAELCLA